VQVPENVGSDDLLDLRQRLVTESPGDEHRRCLHPDVEGTEGRDRRAPDALDLRGVTGVGGNRDRVGAQGVAVRHHVRQRGLAARRQRERSSVLRKRQCRGTPDTAARSHHDD
jgi:hypothetical protein